MPCIAFSTLITAIVAVGIFVIVGVVSIATIITHTTMFVTIRVAGVITVRIKLMPLRFVCPITSVSLP